MQNRTTQTSEHGNEAAAQTRANSDAQEFLPEGGSHLFALSQTVGNRAISELFKRNGSRSKQGPEVEGLNREAIGSRGLRVQAKSSNGGLNTQEEQEADRAAEEATKPRERQTKTNALIVEDDAVQLETGQMRKSEFLAKLHGSVCSAAEEALKGTIWSAAGCPYIDRWFSHYSGKSSQHIERALLKYVPEAAGVTTARAYIPVITERLRRGIEQWRDTGDVSGVPEELAEGGMPGATAAGLIGGLASRALSAVGGAISGLMAGAGRALSGAARAMFKERPGGAAQPADASEVLSQLGSGESIDGSARVQMESAFGSDFSGVRVHTDSRAQALTGDMNARAVTVGRDIAFARGEYSPGTVVGDALLAHELAHVVQQGGGETESGEAQTKSASSHGAFEEEADQAAAGAVVSLWGGTRVQGSGVRAGTIPRLRSGLQLQGCSGTKTATKTGETKKAKPMTEEEKARARFRSDKLAKRDKEIEEAGALLKDVGHWVATEEKKQGKPDITAVEGLDPKQLENAKQAALKLKDKEKLFGAKGLDAVKSKLSEAVARSKGHTGMITELQAAENRMAPLRAGESLDEALAALEKVNDSVDGYEFSIAIERARETLMGDDKKGFAKQISDIREAMLELQNDYGRYPGAISRIQFVVQYFVAVNSPGFKGLPSAEEIKKFKGTLSGSLNSDFKLVFKSTGVMSPFAFFVAYADVLDRQLAILDKMSAAGKAAKTPIPTQGEAEAFFETLKKSTNDEVREAYEQYAGGFFYHRGVASLEDMNQTGVADLYKRKLSIAGTRPLVCSGYAILGAHLFEKAGASVVRFTTAVLATDDHIVNDTIADGHAIVLLSRKGEEFVVSNDSTYATEKNGFDSVWPSRKAAEFHKATGKTNPEALKNLRDSLGKKGEAIRARRAKAGR